MEYTFYMSPYVLGAIALLLIGVLIKSVIEIIP